MAPFLDARLSLAHPRDKEPRPLPRDANEVDALRELLEPLQLRGALDPGKQMAPQEMETDQPVRVRLAYDHVVAELVPTLPRQLEDRDAMEPVGRDLVFGRECDGVYWRGR